MSKKAFLFNSILILAFILTGAVPAAHTARTAQAGFSPALTRLSPEVRAALPDLKENDKMSVIVRLEQQAVYQHLSSTSLSERRTELVQALRDQAGASQAEILSLLEEWEALGAAEDIIPYWIINGVALKASPRVLEALARHPLVVEIVPDRVFPAPQGTLETYMVETNVDVTNATRLWELGYRGQGMVVANMDTGVSLSHPDLVNQWRGGANSWFDPHGEHPAAPTDQDGHGTWTMGVMVGRDHSGSYIGIAPEAQWIAVKIFNDSGYATSSAIHAGYQWLLDPDGDPTTDDSPHVVNNSWSFLTPGCYLDFQDDLRLLRAAGIIPVFAAGNSGPDLSSSVSPSNYPEALSVGAVDNWGAINIGSSRGPTACAGTTGVYPDLVAPGVGIFSSSLNSGYAYATGTSMAAPHVAGGLALLRSAFPSLSISALENALRTSANDLGDPGPDNIYGSGSLDLLAAYTLLDPDAPVIPGTGQDLMLLYLPALFNGR
jgi:subtilisin family serine protease